MQRVFLPPLAARSFDRVCLLDAIPPPQHAAIKNRTITADLTAFIQAAIDAAPSRTAFYAPAGLYPVAGLRLDGSAGNKIGTALVGDGWVSHFQKPADSLLTTAAKKRANVIEMLSGSDFLVKDIKVEGNWSRGGKLPLYGSVWNPGSVYTYTGTNTFVVSTKSDGTTVDFGVPDSVAVFKGGRVFLLKASHTAASDNILADLAAGYWEEVTNQPWDDLTATGYTGFYENDNDYAYRHCLYANGTTAPIANVSFINVETTDAIYGGQMIGSGPLFASRLGFGAVNGRIIAPYAHHNKGSNIGGGFSVGRVISGGTVVGGNSSGVRGDAGCHQSVITGLTVDGQGTQSNGGLNLYKSNDVTIDGCTVRNSQIGVWLNQSNDFNIGTITVDGGGTGVAINTCIGGTIGSINVSDTTSLGVSIKDSRDIAGGAIRSQRCGSHGVYMEASRSSTFSSITARNNKDDGLRLNACFDMAFSSVCTKDNNDRTTPSTTGAGIGLVDTTTSVFTMIQSSDSRAGAAKTQKYGILESGTSDSNTFLGGVTSQNATAAVVTVGASTRCFLVGGPESLRLADKPAAATYLEAAAGVSTVAGGAAAVSVKAHAGSSVTNADLRLLPLGTTGRVRLGALTATVDAPVTGYVEIKTDDGTVRKVAVIS